MEIIISPHLGSTTQRTQFRPCVPSPRTQHPAGTQPQPPQVLKLYIPHSHTARLASRFPRGPATLHTPRPTNTHRCTF